jgi:hypothetical protein
MWGAGFSVAPVAAGGAVILYLCRDDKFFEEQDWFPERIRPVFGLKIGRPA